MFYENNPQIKSEITSLFSKNSPIHTLSECEENLSLSDRLKLFSFEKDTIVFLDRLLKVKCVSDKKQFTTVETNLLEEMNLRLDIPRVYFLTMDSDEEVMEKFISLGYYEEIPEQFYTVRTMNIAS